MRVRAAWVRYSLPLATGGIGESHLYEKNAAAAAGAAFMCQNGTAYKTVCVVAKREWRYAIGLACQILFMHESEKRSKKLTRVKTSWIKKARQMKVRYSRNKVVNERAIWFVDLHSEHSPSDDLREWDDQDILSLRSRNGVVKCVARPIAARIM